MLKNGGMTSPGQQLRLACAFLLLGCAPELGRTDHGDPGATPADPESWVADGGRAPGDDTADAGPGGGFDDVDSGTSFVGADAGSDAGSVGSSSAASTAVGIAPEDAIPGAEPALDGTQTLAITAGIDRYFRVDARPGEHVTAVVRVDPSAWFTTLAALRWDGSRVAQLWETQAYIPGIAPLSVLDPEQPRTFWFRVRSAWNATATLHITRRSFTDGPSCSSGCADLLQLPVPNDPAVDGYVFDPVESIPRYLYGRRDVLMFIRHAGREMRGRGHGPFVTSDLSQWDGDTPGVDVGSPRHASHQRGKDIDLTLYGTDGTAPWRSYCTTTSDARACVGGTVTGFDGYANADLLASLYSSGRVTRVFLDDELIRHVRAGVEADGRISASVRPYFYDGVHLQHWPHHHDHIHVRFAE